MKACSLAIHTVQVIAHFLKSASLGGGKHNPRFLDQKDPISYMCPKRTWVPSKHPALHPEGPWKDLRCLALAGGAHTPTGQTSSHGQTRLRAAPRQGS